MLDPASCRQLDPAKTRDAALGHSARSEYFAENFSIRISVGGYHTCLSRREQGFESPIRKSDIAFYSPPTYNVEMTDGSASRIPLTMYCSANGGGCAPPIVRFPTQQIRVSLGWIWGPHYPPFHFQTF